MDAVDRSFFRLTMSCFATGVAILTTASEGRRYGMTINSLTSVSLDPAQILVCINHGSPTGNAIKERGLFGVSLLHHGQHVAATSFVGPNAARFDAIDCHDGDLGIPLVHGALASLICRPANILSSGDHEIIIGDVIRAARDDGEPLIFFGGKFGGFQAGFPSTKQQRCVA